MLEGVGTSCKDATCDDIKSCLKTYAAKRDTDFNLGDLSRPKYNCRDFVKDAMGKCCLKRGKLFDVDASMPFTYCCSDCARGK